MFYPLFIGGPHPYHYRSEYNGWRGNRSQPYYGSNPAAYRYGPSVPPAVLQSRFPGSHYVQHQTYNAPSVRGAGPANRGGGPGGSGK